MTTKRLSQAARKAAANGYPAYAPTPWGPSEWADNGFAAYINGIEANVYPSDPFGEGTGWIWDVKPTSHRCEWPELFDSGETKTVEAAKKKAAAAARRADSKYPTVQY